MPLKARQRSRLAVLAVLALVGSLLAVSAVPAVAAGDGEPSAKAGYSACVAAATEDAGFTDMDGNFAADAANCLAHYRITVGTSEGVFSPNDSISRAQMALFMVRAATVAGVELDDPEDQGLGDIGNWTDTIQDAINQAVGAGIMSGHDGAFNPSAAVSRQNMAEILDAFLKVADVDDPKEEDIDAPFSDLGMTPYASYNAINRLYEFGVAAGTGDGATFSPNALVSRAQMAVFVTRALGHTNARPAGVSMQLVGGVKKAEKRQVVVVSVRDDTNQPVPDALVEVFGSDMPDEAWNDDGTCAGNKNIHEDMTAPISDYGDCRIGAEDLATEPDGNAMVDLDLPEKAGSFTLWAWTGDDGDEFDIDEDAYVTATLDVKLAGMDTKLTHDAKEHARKLEFGDTITFTIQIVDKDGDPVASEGEEVKVHAVITDITKDPDDGGTDDDVFDGALRPTTRTIENTYKTDAAGRIEFSFSEDDPNPDPDVRNDEVALTLNVTPGSSIPVAADPRAINVTGAADQGEHLSGTVPPGIQIVWTDTESVATSLHLSLPMNYHETDANGVRNTVMATLVDQYGDPVKDQKVSFWSDVTNPADQPSQGLGGESAGAAGSATSPADHRTTSRSGVASKSYTRAAPGAAAEVIGAAFVTVVRCRDTDNDCFDPGTTTPQTDDGPTIAAASTVTHYWAVQSSGEQTGDLLVADTDNNTIVFGTQLLATYKAGDQFQIGGNAVTLEDFERALSIAGAGGTPAADSMAVTFNGADAVNVFNIATNN